MLPSQNDLEVSSLSYERVCVIIFLRPYLLEIYTEIFTGELYDV